MKATRASDMVHELPEDLPEGEHVLWQGAPGAWLMARSLHIRLIAAYLGAMVLWYAVHRLHTAIPGAWLDIARVAGLSGATLLIVGAYAWLVSRNASYTLTNHRLILQVGIAMPMSFNIPFAHIETAAIKRRADGSGDIVLRLTHGDRLSYLIIWPHARPWRLAQSEPMLRAMPEVDRVARILTTLLADTTSEAAPARVPARPASYAPASQAA